MNEYSENFTSLSKLANQAFYRYINQNPEMPMDIILERMKQDLIANIYDETAVEKQVLKLRDQNLLKGVINPKLLEKAAGKKPYFIFFNAKSGDYNNLQKYVEKVSKSDYSVYTLYGDLDNLVCIFATPYEMEELYDFFESGYDPILVEVDQVHTYYGYKVKQNIKTSHLSQKHAGAINQLVNNFSTNTVEELQKNTFIREDLLLGATVLEDYHSTDRVQGIIGINFQRPYKNRTVDEFPDKLFSSQKHGTTFKKIIRSIYRCNRNYDYLLRIVTDTMSELDWVTDLLNQIYDSSTKIETKTYIFAKLYEVLPEFSQQEVKVDFTIALQEQHLEWIQGIEEKSIRPLDETIQRQYQEMEQNQQFELLHALQKISNHSLHDFSFARNYSESNDDITFTDQLLRGFITHKPAEIASAAATLGGYVEKILQGVIQDCLKLVYPAFNLKAAQNDLGLDGTKFDHYTLGRSMETLKRITAAERFKSIGIEFNEIFFSELEDFTEMRNFAAHHELVGFLSENFGLWTHKIIDMHAKAAYLFDDIDQIIYDKNIIQRALEVALLHTNFKQGEYEAKEEIISEIKLSNESIIKLITNSNEQSVNRFYAIIAEFKLLSADQHRFEIKARKVIQYFDNNEELITAHLTPTEQTRLEKLHGFLTKEVPADIFTNILAAILFELITDPNFGNIIMDIIKLIR